VVGGDEVEVLARVGRSSDRETKGALEGREVFGTDP